MRADVEFEGHGGVTLRGWLYLPAGRGAGPGVVMAHGLSGVKEQRLDAYAEIFQAAGLAVLVYDHRNLGESDGTPRQLVNPWAQCRDFGYALDWLTDQESVDEERLGLWGTSFSGGEVVVRAAIDERVRAVVANVPFVGFDGVDYETDLGAFEALRASAEDVSGAGPADTGEDMGPLTVIDEPGAAGEPMFPGHSAAEFFGPGTSTGRTTWRNEVTVQSAFSGAPLWDPGPAFAKLRAALLLVAARHDELVSTEVVSEAWGRAPEPKQLEFLDCTHFEAYVGDEFERASMVMAEFLVEHLSAR